MSTSDTHRPVRQASARLRGLPKLAEFRRPALLVWLIPLGVAAVYLVVFATQFASDIRAIGWSSDYASAFTVTETLARYGTQGHTVLTGSSQWVPIWFGLLTARLPLHHELWDVAPTLLFIASAVTLGWSVSRIADRRLGVLATSIVLVASPWALAFFMAPDAHNTVFPCAALAGAYPIWLACDRHRRSTLVAVSLIAGVILGTCLASDLLVGPTAAIPLLVTACLAGVRRDRRSRKIGLLVGGSVIVAVPIALLTSAIMSSLGWVTLSTPTVWAPLSALFDRSKLLFKGLKALFGGYLGPQAPGFLHTELGLACDIVMICAFLVLFLLGTVTAVKLLWSGWRSKRPDTPVALASSLHVVYWFVSAVSACCAFLLTAETNVANVHESYYATVIFSVAAVIPLLLRSGSPIRWLVPVGVSVFFLASVVGLRSIHPGAGFEFPHYESDITRFAQENRVKIGYSGYWEASSLTWSSDERVLVRPAMLCPNPEGASICQFTMETAPSWYRGQPGRSFLIVDSWESWVGALPPGLGPPLAVGHFGTIHMYVYPYDIASRMGPAPS